MNTLKPLLDFYRERGGKAAWTTTYTARDSKGKACDINATKARSWCLIGAVTLINDRGMQVKMLDELMRRIESIEKRRRNVFAGRCAIPTWQDSVTWASIEKLLKRRDYHGK